MAPRFFAPDAGAPGMLVTLPEDEGEHLTRVLRLGAGDLVHVFNGRGGEFEAVVEAADRSGVGVRVGVQRDPVPEPGLSISLAQAVLKGDKMDDVVRDAVMIGVTTIHPILTSRTEVPPTAFENGRRRDRWMRVAVSSAKQCGRAVVPSVSEPVPLESLAQKLLESWMAGPALMLVEPGASPKAVPLSELDVEPPKAATIIIGPEGGWAPEEVEAGSNVCRLVTLGERTLRADSMALVALAAVFTRWGEF
jgi:16S rRNA (uracil1498-N3)-methyltransferase